MNILMQPEIWHFGSGFPDLINRVIIGAVTNIAGQIFIDVDNKYQDIQ